MPWIRAQTLVPRPSRLSVVVPSAPTVGPPAPQIEPHIFKLQAEKLLPILNLRRTLSWYLLSPRQNIAFLKWTKRRYRWLTFANRCGLVLGLLTLVIPDHNLRYWLVSLACMLTLPASCCSCAMLSLDMLQILAAQYEFWFFTVANAATWAVLGILCHDERLVILVMFSWEIELLIVIDANFRAFLPAITTAAASIPVLLGLLVVVYLRQLTIPGERYTLFIQFSALKIEAVEILLNVMLTLLVFLIRLVYNKRKLLFRRRSRSRTRLVRCVIVRCPLVLRPLASHVVEKGDPDRTQVYSTRIMLKQLGTTAPKVAPSMKAGRATSTKQQLSLVSLRLSTIDTTRTLSSSKSISGTLQLAGLYSVGLLGLTLSGGSMLIPASTNSTTKPLVPVAAFVCALLFCVRFACAFQRDIVRSMLQNFSFLFPSLQFSLACVCLADAMRWDVRCWAVAAYGLWYHWILLLDALTPPGRAQLQFRKQFAVPVMLAVWVGLCSVLYAIVIDSPTLSDRVLLRWSVSEGRPDLTTATKTILLNRIITILLWTQRLMWQILQASGSELVLTKGTLEYYCPFDMIHTNSSFKKLASTSKLIMLPSPDASLAMDQILGRRESSCRRLSVTRLVVPPPKSETDDCTNTIDKRRQSRTSTTRLTSKLGS